MKKPLSAIEEGVRLYDEIAEHLFQGATEREHPFHLISLATIGLDHTPRVRHVVLRQFLRDEHTALIHSDRRSPKVHEITHQPHVAIMCYDATQRMQLRMAATARIHADDSLADARWISSQINSRRCYLTPLAPSTPIEQPRAFKYLSDPWASEMDKEARKNFCVISCRLHSIDFLELSASGHRRMSLGWDEDDRFYAQPLMP